MDVMEKNIRAKRPASLSDQDGSVVQNVNTPQITNPFIKKKMFARAIRMIFILLAPLHFQKMKIAYIINLYAIDYCS